jgi:hypothetical protein
MSKIIRPATGLRINWMEEKAEAGESRKAVPLERLGGRSYLGERRVGPSEGSWQGKEKTGVVGGKEGHRKRRC